MAPLAEKELTLMFYFASDNPLAAEIVTQLKSIKQAGFHPEANVIAQFDPNPRNTETHVFDVNRINKIKAWGGNKIGFVGFQPNDPYVVNLMTDKLWRNDPRQGPIRERVINSLGPVIRKGNNGALAATDFIFDPPQPPPLRHNGQPMAASSVAPPSTSGDPSSDNSDELTPQESLTNFLKFCSENYPARHYMLFILGHGVVVGNDTFLFDENAPVHSLHLRELREVLEEFKGNIENREGVETGAAFDLVSFHSCSMSSLEVACELQGTANYMLASQSPAFVGSWPYRQILIRIFNYLDRKERGVAEVEIKGLLKNIFYYCLYNSYDYMVAGYSFDLCLCDLTKAKVSSIEGLVSDLARALVDGLDSGNPSTRERILLAHLDAQSYFNDNYTDLFDFCFSLQQRFRAGAQNPTPTEWQAITEACGEVMKGLQRGVEGDDDRLIVRSDFAGPGFQYSHGLSVYFPWSNPLNQEFWPDEYDKYRFIEPLKQAGKISWSAFLESYFEDTRRRTRVEEFTETQAPGFRHETRAPRFSDELLEAFATAVFNGDGQLDDPVDKGGPSGSTGADCNCQSIKNYPPFTRVPQTVEEALPVGGEQNASIPVSPTFLDDPTFRMNEQGQSFALDGLGE